MNSFANDGSFLEQFLKEQQGEEPSDQQQQQQQQQQPNMYMAQNLYGSDGTAAGYDYYQQQYWAAGSYGYPPATQFMGGAYQYNLMMQQQQQQQMYQNKPMQSLHQQQQQQQQQQSSGQPSRTLWVGSVPTMTSEADIRLEFSKFGMIENIKTLPQKNCCFVNFSDLQGAINAFENAKNIMLNGCPVRINWGKLPDSLQPQNNPSQQVQSLAKLQEKNPPTKNLWVGNVHETIQEEDLRREFSAFGVIERVYMLPHKNCAFVNYTTIECATAAKNALSGKVLFDRPLKINFGRKEEERPERPEPPPPFAVTPSDEQLVVAINSLAQIVANTYQNGKKLETLVRFKERNNPRIKFLFPGEDGYDFYNWKKWCIKNKHPIDVDPHPPRSSFDSFHHHHSPHPPHHHHQHQQSHQSNVAYLSESNNNNNNNNNSNNNNNNESNHDQNADSDDGLSLPPDSDPLTGLEEEELTNLLRNLTATKASIKKGAEWINNHESCGTDIAVRLQQRIELTNEFEHRLAIIYLIHEVLSSRNKSSDASDDPLSSSSESFYPTDKLTLCILDKIIPILRAACLRTTEGDREKITQIVQNWMKRKIFSEFIIKQIDAGLQHFDNPSKIQLRPVQVRKPSSGADIHSFNNGGDDDDIPPWMLPQPTSSSSSSSAPPWNPHSSSSSSSYQQGQRGPDSLLSKVNDFYTNDESHDRKRRKID